MIAESLSPYYAVFGTPSTWTHNSVAKAIRVIFDRAGAVATVGDVEIQTATPVARCIATDISGVARGDTLLIAGTTYYVVKPEPLNNEETLLHLSLDN